MGQKPFEVAAECSMPGLPTGSDIERVSTQLEQARRRAPDVVRTAVQGPAVFRDRAYVLDARFVVWADDGDRAVQTVGSLLSVGRIPYREMHLSGRALGDAAIPRPGTAAGARPSSPTASPKPTAAGRKPARRVKASGPRKPRAAARPRTRRKKTSGRRPKR